MRIFTLFFICFSFLAHSQAKLTITDAINLVKSNNPQSKVYNYNIEIKRADVTTAGLRPNLIFNQQSLFLANRYYLNNVSKLPGDAGKSPNFIISPYGSQLWFQVTKSYQINGKRSKKIDFQQKSLDFSEKDVDEFNYNIAYKTAIQWLNVWQAKFQLEILKEGKKNVDSLLYINKIKLKNEAITSLELARNQLISDQYTLLLNTASRQLKSELTKLAYLTGKNDEIDIDTEDVFFYVDLPDSVEVLLEKAHSARPDLITDISQTEISKSNIDLQKAMAVPNPEFGLVANPQNSQPYVGWYFQMPLAVFDKNQGNIQRAKIEHEQNNARVDATKTQIRTEIEYLLPEYNTYKENTESYRMIVQNADDILKTVKFSYLRGGTTILDYLNAQQNWFETQKAYYGTLYLYKKSYLDVLYVSGMLTKTNK